MSKVIVIGGGAGGMMAAYSAAKSGHEVILLEKNEKLGKKIYITGKGRCNYSNNIDTEDFFRNVVSNNKFLYSAIYTFDSSQVTALLEENGCKTKAERGGRLFPLSDHASDVTFAIERAMKRAGVKIKLNSEVKTIEKIGEVFKVKTSSDIFESDAIIIATGGLSYPTTGSTGDGYEFAKQFGHEIKALRPALVPFNTAEEYVKDLQGLALKNVELSIFKDNKKLYSDFGEMLFTHFGVSGPLVLSASSVVGKHLEEGKLKGYINLKPSLGREKLTKRIIRDIEDSPKKTMKSIASGLLPSSMVGICLELSDIDETLVAAELTKEKRDAFIDVLLAFPFTIISLREFKEAIITQGGVSVKNINPSTMESKLVPGMYFAGEVIDVDAYTGGFNLQIAFSTGYLAGISIL